MRVVLGVLLLLVAVVLGLLALKILVFHLASPDLYAWAFAALYGLIALGCGVAGVRLLRKKSAPVAASDG
jgi:hypothetical protein